MKIMINKIKTLENKKIYLLIIFLTLILFSSIIRLGIKETHAFYNSETNPIPIFNTKVGDFTGDGESVKQGPIDKNTDVNIIFYTQMPDNPDKYMISKYIPVSGYKVNESASNCYPAKGKEATYSDYNITEDGMVHIKYSETKPTQVVCRIYYDRDKLSDVVIYAYLEDPNGDRTYNKKTYKLVNQVESNYTLVAKECKNKRATFTYDSNGFKVITKGPDTCYAYFSKS